ncbi:MAG: hypothetical protein V3V67_17675 [Myxococcota bacterium]
MLADLRSHESGVYSQRGEDGVIRRIFECIGTTNRYFVEFGARDGRTESNTAYLRIHLGWRGLLMEGDARLAGPAVRREFVTAENVNRLFARHGVPASFDLLSIDIDGNDYWVWRALRYRPRVVVIEYNIFFPPDDAKAIRYDAGHVWDETRYHGASLAALRKLGEAKGYALVCTESWTPNAFFVLRSELPPGFRERPTGELTPWPYFKGPLDAGERPWVAV